jgi:hypothetical protein
VRLITAKEVRQFLLLAPLQNLYGGVLSPVATKWERVQKLSRVSPSLRPSFQVGQSLQCGCKGSPSLGVFYEVLYVASDDKVIFEGRHVELVEV